MLESWSGAGGHVGGEDVVGMAVEILAGSTWWIRLFKLSECVSLIRVPKCRFGVFARGWFAAAVAGGAGGPVAGGGVLPGDCDLDVDAEQPGEDGGGKFDGEVEQCGGEALGGAQAELAQAFGELVGADRLAEAAGEQPGEVPWSPSAAWPRRRAMRSRIRPASGSGSVTGSRPRRRCTASPAVSTCSRVRRLTAAGVCA